MMRLLALPLLLFVLMPATVPVDQLRTVYVTAADRAGQLVLDLTPSDFGVREGGQPRQVVRAALTSDRMQLALIVDDNGTGFFRNAVATLVRRLQGHADIGITRVTVQPQTVVDFTSNAEALMDAVRRLGPMPSTPDGGQLLSAIYEAIRRFEKREALRSVIVAMTVGGEEHSPISAHEVLERRQRTGTVIHVVSVASSAMRLQAAPARASDLLGSGLDLNEVLGDGPRQSGGRREELVATAGSVVGLERIADELLHQYAVVYALPDGTKPTGRIAVTTSRRGITLRAPTHVRDR
jgi:VWFA-related protein